MLDVYSLYSHYNEAPREAFQKISNTLPVLMLLAPRTDGRIIVKLCPEEFL